MTTPTEVRFVAKGSDGRIVNFIGLLAPDARLVDGAHERIVDVLEAQPDIDLLYGDSSLTSEIGQTQVEMRPAFSPDRLINRYDLGPLIVGRESIVEGRGIKGFHEFALVAATSARSVAHVPEILSERQGSPFLEADGEAVATHLSAIGAAMRVAGVDDTGVIVEPTDQPQPRASIVMLTGGARRMIEGVDVLLVANAVASILVGTHRSDVEIVIVVDAKSPPPLGDLLKSLDPERVTIVQDTRPFNFSAANNLGVQAATGEHLVFVNDDCEVRSGDWLSRIAMHLQTPGVGIVGARLLYGDGRLQHGGLIARDGYIEHRFGGYPDDDRSRPSWIENVSAVTGACLGISRSLFDQVGGFPEEFPLNFNDVHLCFAAAELGQRVVLDHRIVLTHHETSSREPGITDTEQQAFESRWPERSTRDPYDHPAYLPVRAQPITPPASLVRLRTTLGLPTPQPRLVAHQPG